VRLRDTRARFLTTEREGYEAGVTQKPGYRIAGVPPIPNTGLSSGEKNRAKHWARRRRKRAAGRAKIAL
jgi:hypothetical protein